jgi:hypothetical protein
MAVCLLGVAALFTLSRGGASSGATSAWAAKVDGGHATALTEKISPSRRGVLKFTGCEIVIVSGAEV